MVSQALSILTSIVSLFVTGCDAVEVLAVPLLLGNSCSPSVPLTNFCLVIAPNRAAELPDDQRIVITGVGLTAPNGNDWTSFREALLEKRSGVQPYEIRYFGKTLAGICDFDTNRYQKKKEVRRGTRAGTAIPLRSTTA